MDFDILSLLQEEAGIQFPAFPNAFGILKPAASAAISSVFATDGLHLYFHPQLLRQLFLDDPRTLKRCYLHLHLHCLCSHMIQTESVSAPLWDLACDLSVELLLEHLTGQTTCASRCLHLITSTPSHPPTKQDSNTNSKAAPSCAWIETSVSALQRTGWMDVKTILALFRVFPELPAIAREYSLDSHEHWFRSLVPDPNTRILAGSDPLASSAGVLPSLTETQLCHLEDLQSLWKQKQPDFFASVQHGHRDRSIGALTEEAELTLPNSIDYRKFLRRFAVPREEAILDLDSFDYIPYYYGMNWCGIPLIEPLEYKEVSRLDELAIAIDTSGSCSGRIVRRFLEETWNILSQRENFFSRMRLHLIQCDLMIQEHRIFTSVEEWEAYLPDLKIHGHGDTDFTPVFDYLETLIQKHEIRHLRGLLYFTDGDGIFPTAAPSFDTAFVFLNQQTEKHAIPAWAIRLNLQLPDDF